MGVRVCGLGCLYVGACPEGDEGELKEAGH